MLSTSDALFMSDMADGSLFSAPTNTGAIYEVMAVSFGDYNHDGTVDAADYVVWRKTGINGPQGYNEWRAHFCETAASGAGARAVTLWV